VILNHFHGEKIPVKSSEVGLTGFTIANHRRKMNYLMNFRQNNLRKNEICISIMGCSLFVICATLMCYAPDAFAFAEALLPSRPSLIIPRSLMIVGTFIVAGSLLVAIKLLLSGKHDKQPWIHVGAVAVGGCSMVACSKLLIWIV